MKPVSQSKLYQHGGIHNGNCFAACLASLLEIPLWMVPPFEDMFGRGHGQWRERAEEWLDRFFMLRLVRREGHPVDELPQYYIANGESLRGVHHSVIYTKGTLVHDPHWEFSGVKSVEWVYSLEPK